MGAQLGVTIQRVSLVESAASVTPAMAQRYIAALDRAVQERDGAADAPA